MPLKLYNKKRDFSKTKEPEGREKKTKKQRFVVQEHHATRLHFDFRLEMEGVLKSWAVPKGPSMNPNDKRLAMMVEDHPVDYMMFQGSIPLGEYGGGEVRRWDLGTYEATGDIPIEKQVHLGKLTFILHGKRLKGEFHMVHMHGREENAWLMFKHKDEYADPKWEMKPLLHYGSKKEAPESMKKSKLPVWGSNRKHKTEEKEDVTGLLQKLVNAGKKKQSKRGEAKSSKSRTVNGAVNKRRAAAKKPSTIKNTTVTRKSSATKKSSAAKSKSK